MQSGINERIVEGVLATISQFCGNVQYHSALRDSHAIGTVALHLMSADNVVSKQFLYFVPIFQKCQCFDQKDITCAQMCTSTC